MLGHFSVKYPCWIISWVSVIWSFHSLSARASLAEATFGEQDSQTHQISRTSLSTEKGLERAIAQATQSSENTLESLEDCLITCNSAEEEISIFSAQDDSRSLQNRNTENPSETKEKPRSDKKKPKTAAPLLEAFITSGSIETSPNIAAPSITDEDGSSSESVSDDPHSADTGESPLTQESLSQDSSLPSADPELGVIQVEEPRRDPELGVIELRNSLQDPELGILQLRQISPLPRRRPFVFLSTYVTASNSDNIFRIEDPDQGRFGDSFLRPGIRLQAFPSIGPDTNLLASVETNFLRYQDQTNSNRNEIRFQAGIQQRFSDQISGQLSFSRLLRFDPGYQDRSFSSNQVSLVITHRDILTPQLTLSTSYIGQIFLSDPERFSNVGNTLVTSLRYRISPQWDTSISYQLTILDFTQQSRHDTSQEIRGQLRYALTPSTRISLFGGLRYGRSSEDDINFDNTFFGVRFNTTFSLF